MSVLRALICRSSVPGMGRRMVGDGSTEGTRTGHERRGLDCPSQGGLDYPSQSGLDYPSQGGLEYPNQARHRQASGVALITRAAGGLDRASCDTTRYYLYI